MALRFLSAGFWISGCLSLCHMLVWPIDGLWLFRGAFTMFCLLNAVHAFALRSWLRLTGIACAYAFGWLAVLGWYLILFNAVHQEVVEEREDKLLGQFARAAVAELSKSEPTLAYAGTMGVRGPEKSAGFFENFSWIWDQFFHLGDFLLVVRYRGKIVEVSGNGTLARQITEFGKNPDLKADERIRKGIEEKILNEIRRVAGSASGN